MTRHDRTHQGRIVLVTGGSRNIGRAISERFARDGATVVVNGIVPGEAQRLADGLRADGLDAVGLDADVADPAQVDAMLADVGRRFGVLDVLVNNAALTMRGRVPLMELTLDDWEATFGVNARGTFLCTVGAVPLLSRSGACVVNVSSIGATRAHRSAPAYDATKGAIESFTRVAAIELAPRGIRVNAVAPGPISNDRFERLDATTQGVEAVPIPLGRVGQGQDVAGPVSFLASGDAAFITGHVLTIDGGLTAQARQSSSEIDVYAGTPR